MSNILALTWAFPESYWLPLWKEYYTHLVDEVQVWSTDEEMTALEQGRVFTRRINDSLPELLKEFDVVLVASNDEFILPDPTKYKNLRDYIERNPKPILRTTGYNVVTLAEDAPFDISKRVTDQRTHWYYDKWYSKPSIVRTPVQYISGWHFCKNNKDIEPNDDLVLMHLREANLDALMRLSPERYPARSRKFDYDYEERLRQSVPIPDKWRLI